MMTHTATLDNGQKGGAVLRARRVDGILMQGLEKIRTLQEEDRLADVDC